MKRIAVLLACLLTVGACRNGTTAPALTEDQTELPADQIIFDLDHKMTVTGVRKANLNADTAYLYRAGNNMELRVVRLTFFNEAGAETGTLTAESGQYDPRSGTMVARGNVVLNTRDTQGQRQLETEELHYHLDGDRMWSDKPVVLREGGTTVRGTSFTADARFQNRTIVGARTEGGLESAGRRFSF